jgi:hypothetical protein
VHWPLLHTCPEGHWAAEQLVTLVLESLHCEAPNGPAEQSTVPLWQLFAGVQAVPATHVAGLQAPPLQ